MVGQYISDTDVSKDNIQTPKVVLCIAGGASAFKHIHDQLDPTDISTGTGERQSANAALQCAFCVLASRLSHG